MSRFGMNNENNNPCNRFAYNPFHQEVIFQRQNHWEFLRNNIDGIIKNSQLLKQNENKIMEECELHVVENSRCNEIETIYECNDETEPVKSNPIASVVEEEEPVVEEIKVAVENPPEQPQEAFPAKKRMDFASVVFKYRNKLAKQKHKELQTSI